MNRTVLYGAIMAVALVGMVYAFTYFASLS
jgi:hypothetical protein